MAVCDLCLRKYCCQNRKQPPGSSCGSGLASTASAYQRDLFQPSCCYLESYVLFALPHVDGCTDIQLALKPKVFPTYTKLKLQTVISLNSPREAPRQCGHCSASSEHKVLHVAAHEEICCQHVVSRSLHVSTVLLMKAT